MARSNKRRTPKKKAESNPLAWRSAFLATLIETGQISAACKAAGVARSTAYKHRNEDADFAAAWAEALDIAIGTLEDEAWRRARDGIEKPIFYRGEVVGTVREYSDTLLIFLLKAHRPGLYREITRHEVANADGQPFQVGVRELSDDDLAAIAAGRSS